MRLYKQAGRPLCLQFIGPAQQKKSSTQQEYDHYQDSDVGLDDLEEVELTFDGGGSGGGGGGGGGDYNSSGIFVETLSGGNDDYELKDARQTSPHLKSDFIETATAAAAALRRQQRDIEERLKTNWNGIHAWIEKTRDSLEHESGNAAERHSSSRDESEDIEIIREQSRRQWRRSQSRDLERFRICNPKVLFFVKVRLRRRNFIT